MFTYEELWRRTAPCRPKSAGRSVWGRELLWYTVGSGPKKLFINGAHRGSDPITARLCADFYDYIQDKADGWTVYLMPMVNPDGIAVAQGLLPRNTELYEKLRRMNCWNDIYKVWQANANGVDLSRNYDADFRRMEERGPAFCAGAYPESEPETRAVVGLARQEKFDMVISLDADVGAVRHGFRGYFPEKSREIAREFSLATGYAVDETAESEEFGSFKDWFVETFRRPGFTVELGKEEEIGLDAVEQKLFPAIEKAMLTYGEGLC